MNKNNFNTLVTEALAIEAEEAKDAGAIGYMARALVQATLPHSKCKTNEYERKNGLFKLTILAPSKIGVPYGTIPRLLISWLTTEAVRTKKKDIILGRNLNKFMEQLDLIPTGGRWGSITRLRDQMQRLFSSAISCTYDDGKHWSIKNVQPISKADLWWDPKNPSQGSLFESSISLGTDFFNEVIERPVPIDIRAIRALKRSPLALDIYCWLTYRYSYLKKKIEIPWAALQIQFGSNYTFDEQGMRNFKKAFVREYQKVSLVYSSAKADMTQKSLVLLPSKCHINS